MTQPVGTLFDRYVFGTERIALRLPVCMSPIRKTASSAGPIMRTLDQLCEQWGLALPQAMEREFQRGMAVVSSGETAAGAARFARGQGRHGES